MSDNEAGRDLLELVERLERLAKAANDSIQLGHYQNALLLAGGYLCDGIRAQAERIEQLERRAERAESHWMRLEAVARAAQDLPEKFLKMQDYIISADDIGDALLRSYRKQLGNLSAALAALSDAQKDRERGE